MEYRPDFYSRNDLPKVMLEISDYYEKKFGINFSSFYYFSKNLLLQLHNKTKLSNDNFNVIITSNTNFKIKEVFSNLTKIANSDHISIELSKQYLDALLNIYGDLPRKPDTYVHESILTVAPEREGRILAEQMKWLSGNTCIPNLKRIPFMDGLIIGLFNIEIEESYDQCNIIDGAIASGATIISIIDRLKERINSFNIFSVHSSLQGLNAILKYTSTLNITISITVGHVTEGLNNKYYAIQDKYPSQMQVGDLGDIISIMPGFNSFKKN